jgi:DNA-directed RNA polymerase specialized sigma24 family protein
MAAISQASDGASKAGLPQSSSYSTRPKAEVIRLRYIVGLTEDETAAALGISPETVKLDARKAKAFFKSF